VKRNRFSVEQIVVALKHGGGGGADGGADSPGRDQRMDVYRWKKEYEGWKPIKCGQIEQLHEEDNLGKEILGTVAAF
jgi:hypothetical protein